MALELVVEHPFDVEEVAGRYDSAWQTRRHAVHSAEQKLRRLYRVEVGGAYDRDVRVDIQEEPARV